MCFNRHCRTHIIEPMTVEELIGQLETLHPYLVVQLWDPKVQRFTEKFSLTPSLSDDEVLIVPSTSSRSQEAEKSWKPLFEPRVPRGAGG